MHKLIHVPTKTEDMQYRMVCFPYAGGSATPYYAWRPELPANIESAVIQLPGRGKSFNAPA
ncbi:thioesterase domain-containing protein [Teredinibacter turnerae]|uniref:thioesterase domain-containing protein n=1 Tax=Teredinibacter turnerae TaxID=2426 RepID=UPI0012FC8E57